MADLLIELFSEEIPARMQARAAEDLRKLMTDGLVGAGLTYAAAAAFVTPRRLALSVEGVSVASVPVREERKGPAVGAPDAALQGFLRSTGLTLEQLEKRADKKGDAWFAVTTRPGRPAAAIVAEVLEALVRGFPWPKSMRWGTGSLRWVRPLHSIICLLVDQAGAEVVPLTIDGLVAGAVTQGHRFLSRGAISVTSFDDYEAKLKRAHVMLRPADRAALIWADATTQAFANGLEVVADAALLAEVAGLVEWPVVLMGPIDAAFLDLPPEVLQTSMREHQKFFSVRNPATGRIERFITVANIETPDHGATILAGNAKVLTARLSDARFFWDNDLRVARAGMGEWLAGLSRVTFHNKLGSQADRVARIASLAREIAPMVGADPDLAEQAARVAKADLRSAMVGEFPELQGLMGRYYCAAAGLPPEVAAAAQEHWQPLGPSDAVPSAPVSVAVALADKIDILAVFWHLNEKPTGSKDPFALRRAAIGLTKLVEGNSLRLSLRKFLPAAFRRVGADNIVVLADLTAKDKYIPYPLASGRDLIMPILHDLDSWREDDLLMKLFSSAFEWELSQSEAVDFALKVKSTIFAGSPELTTDLIAFLHDRLKVHLRDEGIPHDVIDACLAMPGNDDLTLLVARTRALAAFLQTDDGTNLIQGFRRANNILTQAEAKDGVAYAYGPDVKFADHPAETALFAALDRAEAAIAPAMAREDFAAAMTAMAALRAPIDAFFESVQINSDNTIIRRNRLNLLHRIRTICLSVADLTKLAG